MAPRSKPAVKVAPESRRARRPTPRELRVGRGAVRVRGATQEDAEPLAELLEQLGYPASGEQVRARLSSLARSGDYPVLVAELSLPTGELFVAGLLSLALGRLLHRDSRRAEITALVTDRRFRHRGTARALLERAEALARAAGCDLVCLRSSHQRDDAHAFYRAVGFEETHLAFDKRL